MSLLIPQRTIIDLCAGSGAWSEPYVRAGYNVIRVEWKDGWDARIWPSRPSERPRIPSEFDSIEKYIGKVWGIMAAPVCTVFTGCGAKHPRSDDEIREGLALADACLRIQHVVKPRGWWVMENPVGKLRKWHGPPRMSFNPCDYGDPYTKRTLLWGNFRIPKRTPVVPTEGSKMHKNYGGKSAKTKAARSVTPVGFAEAFFRANP